MLCKTIHNYDAQKSKYFPIDSFEFCSGTCSRFIQAWRTSGLLTTGGILYTIAGSIFLFTLSWAPFALILYLIFHTSFEHGTFVQTSFTVWFKFTGYLMVLGCLASILRVIAVSFASPVTLSFFDSGTGEISKLISLPFWYIIINYAISVGETILATIIAYKVTKMVLTLVEISRY